MTNDTPLPLSFRADVLQRIMPGLRAGECCSLVGVSGVGKSNLARFLQRQDVHRSYWGTDTTWVMLIDSHGLVLDDRAAEYLTIELMIHQLIMEAERRHFSAEFVSYATDLHERLVGQPRLHLALRYLERLCRKLCEDDQLQLIFVFDQFEDLWHSLSAQFFLNLRSLRDQFKYRVVYLVMTREQLQQSHEDSQAVEAFWELFSSHVSGLGMYSEDDARFMLDRLAQRYGRQIDPRDQQAILTMSGRHPALVRALFWAFHQSPIQLESATSLLTIPAVAEEITKIWLDLTLIEQQVVRLVALDRQTQQRDAGTVNVLKLKEILVDEPPRLFSPLVTAYVARQNAGDMTGILVDLRSRQVWIDGHLIESSFSPLEFNLLAELARNGGHICKREDLLRVLYPKEEVFDVNDQRLDTILRRLRETLQEDGRKPRYLITHRGVGIQLVQGTIREE